MKSLLEVENLKISFGENIAVKGINFCIKKGQCVALVGESGSGKSVTALSILKLLNNSKTSGKISIDGKDIFALNDKELRKIRGGKIAFIFQEPMTSLNPLHNIGKQIMEVLAIHKDMTGKIAINRTIELLKIVGFTKAKERLKALPHELSGGERQRVMIAMALAGEPELLIADEPTTALDASIQSQIISLLKELQTKLNMAILFISHDLSLVKRIASYTYVMKKGEIVEQGETLDLMEHPKEKYTIELVNAVPKAKESTLKPNAPLILSIKDMSVSYGKHKVLNNVSLEIKEGSTLGLVGESGSGKTTLGLSLLKLIPSKGELYFKDKFIPNAKVMHSFRKNMQIVFQDPYSSLNPRMNIEQIVGEGLEVYEKHLSKDKRRAKIIETLEKTGLGEDILHRYPHEFSGGQRQRIAIARALVLLPNFIVLDEPTSALDVSVQVQIVELLQNLKKEFKLSYLLITHDMKVVKALADYVAVMKEGKIIEIGCNKDIFERPRNSYTQMLINSSF